MIIGSFMYIQNIFMNLANYLNIMIDMSDLINYLKKYF